MIMCYVKQIMTWGLRMEISTDNLKSLAQQLAEIVSAELMNAEEDVTVRDLETGLRRRLQEMGRLGTRIK